MKKIAAFLIALIVLVGSIGALSEKKEVGVIDQELKFQNLKWGISDKSAVDVLSAIGLIDKYYFSGSGSKPGFRWPKEDSDLRISSTPGLLPDIVRENGMKGLWSLRFTPKKTIGGHDASGILFCYTGNIGAKSIADTPDHLSAVVILYEKKSTDIPVLDMYVDLLIKLTEQYGMFKIYINSKMINFTAKQLKKGNNKEIQETLKKKVMPLSTSVTKFKENGIYAFAVMHGTNNTGITLRLINEHSIELIYSKTDTFDSIDKMAEVLEQSISQKEDIGL